MSNIAPKSLRCPRRRKTIRALAAEGRRPSLRVELGPLDRRRKSRSARIRARHGVLDQLRGRLAGKPDPEPFRQACLRLGLAPEPRGRGRGQCHGRKSALAAGLYVMGYSPKANAGRATNGFAGCRRSRGCFQNRRALRQGGTATVRSCQSRECGNRGDPEPAGPRSGSRFRGNDKLDASTKMRIAVAD